MFSKLLVFLLVLFGSNTIMIDRISAVVDEEIITFTDIDKSILLYPIFRKEKESERSFYKRVLKDLIDYKVVYLEYKDEFVLLEEDYEEVQIPIITKLGSLDKLMSLIKKYDMSWQDFRDFIKEKVMYEKVLREKFSINIIINFKEIESFYNKVYVPMQKRLKLKPKTLIEMTPLIEKHLRKSRTDEKLADWLENIRSSHKIENKLKMD